MSPGAMPQSKGAASSAGKTRFPIERPPLTCFVRRSAFDKADPYRIRHPERSEEHTSELQSLMRISYAVFCLNKKRSNHRTTTQYCNQIITVTTPAVHNNQPHMNSK